MAKKGLALLQVRSDQVAVWDPDPSVGPRLWASSIESLITFLPFLCIFLLLLFSLLWEEVHL